MLTFLVSTVVVASAGCATAADLPGRWSEQKANAWDQETGWLVGCNFAPSTAINQLEMWQTDSFDLNTIDRELGWAERLGFNSVRVFLHDIPWKQDSEAFLKRIDQFLEVAAKHHIGVMFVFFDSVWDPFPKPGKQREPKPHVHNSGWVQSPGLDLLKDLSKHDSLQPYVQGVLRRFGQDKRVHCWDLFNEPDNTNDSSYGRHEPKNKADLALALLNKTFRWAREINPKQPLTVGVWREDWSNEQTMSPFNRFLLENSDVISYHCYGDLADMRNRVGWLKRYGRPLLCTEYMARPTGSTFANILPFLKEARVSAYNWGFVDGKTQTIYPWDTWRKTYTTEPPLWFHDIFRKDGTPYRTEEVELIQQVTGKRNP